MVKRFQTKILERGAGGEKSGDDVSVNKLSTAFPPPPPLCHQVLKNGVGDDEKIRWNFFFEVLLLRKRKNFNVVTLYGQKTE